MELMIIVSSVLMMAVWITGIWLGYVLGQRKAYSEIHEKIEKLNEK